MANETQPTTATPNDAGSQVSSVGGPATDSSATGMTPEMMKSDLGSKMKKLDMMNNSLKTKDIVTQNNLDDLKNTLMQSLFASMKKLGVDPGDQQSVQDFLAQLYDYDPDLYTLFETAFVTLTSAPGEGAPAEETPMGEGAPASSPMDMAGLMGAMNGAPGGQAPTAPTATPMAPPAPDMAATGNPMDKFAGLKGMPGMQQ